MLLSLCFANEINLIVVLKTGAFIHASTQNMTREQNDEFRSKLVKPVNLYLDKEGGDLLVLVLQRQGFQLSHLIISHPPFYDTM